MYVLLISIIFESLSPPTPTHPHTHTQRHTLTNTPRYSYVGALTAVSFPTWPSIYSTRFMCT